MSQKQHQETLVTKIPQVLRNMRFAKKLKKKGLKKMQANNVKAMYERTEAIKALVKPMDFKSKTPKSSSCQISRLAYTLSLGNVLESASPRTSGSASQSPRPTLHPGCSCSGSSGSGSQRCWDLQEGSRVEVCLHMWGQTDCCDPWAAVCLELVSSCAICTIKSETRSVKTNEQT